MLTTARTRIISHDGHHPNAFVPRRDAIEKLETGWSLSYEEALVPLDDPAVPAHRFMLPDFVTRRKGSDEREYPTPAFDFGDMSGYLSIARTYHAEWIRECK